MASPRLMLCGVMSGAGKTTVTCGLLQALVNRASGRRPLSAGPDYIDPMFHATVIGAKTGNLDGFFTGPQVLRYLLARESAGMDLSILEGGDGLLRRHCRHQPGLQLCRSGGHRDSGGAGGPGQGHGVICSRRGGRVAAGFSRTVTSGGHFEPDLPVLYQELKVQIEARRGVRVFGYLPEMPDLTLQSRHLGLQLPEEVAGLGEKLRRLAARLEETLDIEGLLTLAASASLLTGGARTSPQGSCAPGCGQG